MYKHHVLFVFGNLFMPCGHKITCANHAEMCTADYDKNTRDVLVLLFPALSNSLKKEKSWCLYLVFVYKSNVQDIFISTDLVAERIQGVPQVRPPAPVKFSQKKDDHCIGGSRISRRGAWTRYGGAWTSDAGTFHRKGMRKWKNWVP